MTLISKCTTDKNKTTGMMLRETSFSIDHLHRISVSYTLCLACGVHSDTAKLVFRAFTLWIFWVFGVIAFFFFSTQERVWLFGGYWVAL